MFYSPKISALKKSFLYIFLAASSLCTMPSYANVGPVPMPDFTTTSIRNLVAGYGSSAISNNLMNTAPVNDSLTIAINSAQATYLLFPTSPLVSPLTQQLLSQSANLDDKSNNIIAFTWNPDSKTNPDVEKNPLQSIDINSLLQPLSYNEAQAIAAKNVINALNSSLAPINTVNFNQLVANLNGNKTSNLNVKLNEKPIKEYLASLRSYLATQSIALSNLYQLYAERQPLNPDDPAVKSTIGQLPSEIKGPYSSLKLENFMATRRILDKDWYKNDLIHENPATLQRQQVELLAENLAESYHTRMTLERLLATMSVLVLELNNQGRSQLIQQAQNINNPNSTPG
ncbi:MAG: Dot/Icm secretion system protein IcmX [Pseudomonadota bacterium]